MMGIWDIDFSDYMGDKLGHIFNLLFSIFTWRVGLGLLLNSKYFEYPINIIMILISITPFNAFTNSFSKGISWYLHYIVNGWIKVRGDK